MRFVKLFLFPAVWIKKPGPNFVGSVSDIQKMISILGASLLACPHRGLSNAVIEKTIWWIGLINDRWGAC